MIAPRHVGTEILTMLRFKFRRRNAAKVEAEFAGFGLKSVFQSSCRLRGQKSRSAYVADGGMPRTFSLSNGRKLGRDFNRAYQVFTFSSSSHGTSPR